MIEELLAKEESKTLEFKENTTSLQKIIQTVVAFANTAGGTIVIGVEDKSKEVVGIADPLKEEEHLANAIADNIAPLLLPTFQFCTLRNRQLILVHVPHSPGPYYIKSRGPEGGTYVRMGSTNRIADEHTLNEARHGLKAVVSRPFASVSTTAITDF